MMFCYFAHFRRAADAIAGLDEAELSSIEAAVARVTGLSRALLHEPVPGGAAHAFPHDEAAPPLVVQLYAERIESLEDALRPRGSLQALASSADFPSLSRLKVQQQIMLVRDLPMEALPRPDDSIARRCSYLVHYPGHAADLDAWHRHYIDHHPPIMRRFPHVREIEICTRLDWMGGLPGMRVEFMQRNKLMFDSPAALSEALASPIIGEMRADFHKFPEFAGGNVHYPMITREIAL